MNIKRIALPAVIGTVLCLVATSVAQAQQAPAAKPAFYNTAKQKLLDGKQVFSFTQSKMDPAGYCEAAKHYDYTWFEMQHSTLEFADIEKMIAACPHAAGYSHDPAAGRAGMAHPACHRYRRTGRHHSHGRRCGPGARGGQVGALSAARKPQPRARASARHLGHQRHRLPSDHQ